MVAIDCLPAVRHYLCGWRVQSARLVPPWQGETYVEWHGETKTAHVVADVECSSSLNLHQSRTGETSDGTGQRGRRSLSAWGGPGRSCSPRWAHPG